MTTSLPIRSFAIGAATGLRSMTGAAALTRCGNWGRAMSLLALGEYVVDKLPNVPARTTPPALAVRAIVGSLAGRSVALSAGTSAVVGAVVGLAGAIGASYAGVAYRKFASRYVPPAAAALLEDGVAILIARTAASRS